MAKEYKNKQKMKDFLQKLINFLFQKNVNIPCFILLALGLFVIFILIIAIVFGISLSASSKQNEKLKKDLLSLQNQIQQSKVTTSTYQPQSTSTATTTETQTTTSPATTATTTNTENITSPSDPEKQKVLDASKIWVAQYYPDKSQNASFVIQFYDGKNASVFVNGPSISMTLQLIKRPDTNQWAVYSPTPPH